MNKGSLDKTIFDESFQKRFKPLLFMLSSCARLCYNFSNRDLFNFNHYSFKANNNVRANNNFRLIFDDFWMLN